MKPHIQVYFCEHRHFLHDEWKAEAFACLNASELSRYHRFTRSLPQRTFLLTRLLLKTALASRLGRAASNIHLAASKNGKPYIEDETGLQLNISHSGKALAVAIADCNLGIDVEDHLKLQKVLPLAGQYINDQAASDIACASNAALALDRLTLYWTTLESLVKFQDSSIFKVRRAFVLPPAVCKDSCSFNFAGQQFFSLAVANDFRITLCSPLSEQRCDFQQITPDTLNLLHQGSTSGANKALQCSKRAYMQWTVTKGETNDSSAVTV
ncbi:4'-phosphopantetheinyl transferase family protein [Rheinheimera baltica]|uniref:4'-phosphopantetheinyl transferase family protein n=1 Tax=Rheinheimera baltica TaxID=67576 RepID=UPI0004145054|nr:hypothetical protein [Rheinheimera baltica]